MPTTGTATEKVFAEKMEAEGWKVYKNGFPDFLCVKDGRTLLVEVKQGQNDKLKPHQVNMLTHLNNCRPEVLVWIAISGEFLSIKDMRPTGSLPKLKIEESEEKFGNSNLSISLAPLVLKTLHKANGKTFQEIADMFGVTAEAVRQRVLKAKEQ